MREGNGAGMAKFIALTSVQGPIPADYTEQPAPDPAAFGMPTDDDGSRDDPLLAQNMISCTHYEPDYDALRSASTRVVLARGCGVGGHVHLPRGRGGGGAPRGGPGGLPRRPRRLHGRGVRLPGDPDAFAVTLREVLD